MKPIDWSINSRVLTGLFIENGYRHDPRQQYAAIGSLVQRDGRIVDLGCGNGLLLHFVLSHATVQLDPFGVDINPDLIARARELLPDYPAENFVVEDIRAIVPRSGYFAFILMNPFQVLPQYNRRIGWAGTGDCIDLVLEYLCRCRRGLSEDGTLIAYVHRAHAESYPDIIAAMENAARDIPLLQSCVSEQVLLWTCSGEVACGKAM